MILWRWMNGIGFSMIGKLDSEVGLWVSLWSSLVWMVCFNVSLSKILLPLELSNCQQIKFFLFFFPLLWSLCWNYCGDLCSRPTRGWPELCSSHEWINIWITLFGFLFFCQHENCLMLGFMHGSFSFSLYNPIKTILPIANMDTQWLTSSIF